jgi:endonuclease/exonuclease/phosphatase (EEP) superfamily protein YafD
VLTRVLAPLFAALVALPCVLVSGSRLVGGSYRTPIPQLAAFAPWAVLGWVVVLVLLVSARWWWAAVVVLVFLAVQATWVLPPWDARAAAGDRPGAVAVRVMTINVYVGAADLAQILRLVDRDDVDLLVVQEALPVTIDRLDAGLQATLPHLLPSDPTDPAGTVIWSRWPLSSLGPPLGVGGEISRSMLRVPGAVPVTVTGVHTVSPGRGRITAWNRDLQSLVQAAQQTSGPQLMLGDFNASRDHGPFRRLLETGLVDGAEAVRTPVWRGVTWPANKRRMPSAVRLDHVLVTPESIGVRSLRTVTISGTDHRAVLADLEFAPIAGQTRSAD